MPLEQSSCHSALIAKDLDASITSSSTGPSGPDAGHLIKQARNRALRWGTEDRGRPRRVQKRPIGLRLGRYSVSNLRRFVYLSNELCRRRRAVLFPLRRRDDFHAIREESCSWIWAGLESGGRQGRGLHEPIMGYIHVDRSLSFYSAIENQPVHPDRRSRVP